MEPIIMSSFLDTDFYKFTMGQLVFHKYPDVPVAYSLTNRTRSVRLADFMSEVNLRRELDHARTLRFSNTDLHYLRGTNEYGERMFKEDYLEFLRNLRLPDYNLCIGNDGQFVLEFRGRWSEAIYWETIALPIINELYYRAKLSQMSRFERDAVHAAGTVRLAEKIRILRRYHELTFSDFGTRRRFAKYWHDYVVRVCAEELPRQFLGTSNVKLAEKYGIMPMGTCAHETFMAMGAIIEVSGGSIRDAHPQVMQDWWDEYGWGLSIALTDTWGSDYFFSQMTSEQARTWKGLRQDSGDPFDFGEKAIRFYKRHGVDPREKLIVFSDGLDVPTMIKIHEQFLGRIRVTFGWGTNLTNDLGIPALSLVIKLTQAMGRGTVKLSDNLAKAIGKLDDIARYKLELGYTNNLNQECKY